MQALALFLAIISFLTGSLNSVQDSLPGALLGSGPSPLQALTNQLLQPEPIRNIFYRNPDILSSSAAIIDADTGKVLFEQNADTRLPIASLTKIMTALVVLQNINDLNEVVVVPKAAADIRGSQMYLRFGETITVRNLLYGTLVESANDAAYALAVHTFGNTTRFVDAMNQSATALALSDTHFTNSYGADNVNHFSTAHDLANLAAQALQNDIFRSIVSTPSITVSDTTARFKHQLRNTNQLVGRYDNVIGVKTGTTLKAGESLVVAALGNSGQTVIAVLLNSPDRFLEGKVMLDWALKSHTWITPL